MVNSTVSLKTYYAGSLFDFKAMVGNHMLASQIEEVSGGRYEVLLPQDMETGTNRAVEIRDADLAALIQADAGIFHFDGPELDSGTVVEFIFAKLLDIPAVVIRTDFRSAGDQGDGDPWNLMCSFYPRTEKLVINSMLLYQQLGRLADKNYPAYAGGIAAMIVDKLDAVTRESPVLEDAAVLREHYERIIQLAGPSLLERMGKSAGVQQLLERKLRAAEAGGIALVKGR